MDKLNQYRQIIQRILSTHVEIAQRQTKPGVERFMVADDKRDHYQLFSLGWTERKRVRNLHAYVRLHDGKFWIEHDLTEDGIATELEAAGVPQADIVLAFHAPELRSYSEFAVA